MTNMKPDPHAAPPPRRTTARRSANPLLEVWASPHELPPFERIKPAHFRQAFDHALKIHRAEIRAAAAFQDRPDFDNTVGALERSGELLQRVAAVFFNLATAHTNAEMQAIERTIAPALANHNHKLYTNVKLFERIRFVHERRGELALSAEQQRVLEKYVRAFQRSGAHLKGKAKRRMQAIVARLAELQTRFAQNVLADEAGYRLELNEPGDVAGLPAFLLDAAADAAKSAGSSARYVITLSRSSIEPFLQFSNRRDLREAAFDAWMARGAMSDERDNRHIILEILRLRRESAQLIGYRDYPHFALEETMAKTADAARSLLMEVWPKARAQALTERDVLQKAARQDGENAKIGAADWRYYAERVRRDRHNLDETEIKPYFQLDNIIMAAFDTASRLFGLRFEERFDIPLYHPDVRIWDVFSADGTPRGLFLGDYFARPSKRGGAWMSSLRSQSRLDGEVRPIIVNVLNFSKAAGGAPTLLSLDDARTLFHEFGHGLHGLLSNVTYPMLAGTNVASDFVELPSQLFEHWLLTPEILQRYALHADTGKPMPGGLLKRLLAARHFNTGFATVEYLAAAIVDLDLHEADPERLTDLDEFEREVRERIGMPGEIVLRHRPPHFLHLFASDGYAAAYYSYMWSEVMDADAFAAFEETGDTFDAATARRLHDYIYSSGGSLDPEDAYKAFRGSMPGIEAMLEKRGLRVR